jgi:hypothetical protein
LEKEGIRPDIVMVADPQNLMYLFENYDASKIEALLIGVACQPELISKYKDKVISFNVNGPLDGWISDIFDDVNYRGACGSVSSMAFLLSSVLNCDPIILVGQDLSYSNGKQYSQRSADGELDVQIDEENHTFTLNNITKGLLEMNLEVPYTHQPGTPHGQITTLPGYYGGKVYTNPSYAMFHSEFERLAQINLNANSDLRLLNCTEGGAYIEGFEHIPLEQAIKILESGENAELGFADIFQKIFDSTDREIRLSKLGRTLNEIESTLVRSMDIAKKCLSIASKRAKNKKNLEELSSKEKDLLISIQASNFISMALQNEIKAIVQLADSASTLEGNLNASKLLYNLIINEGKKILPHILASINDYQLVIAEKSLK